MATYEATIHIKIDAEDREDAQDFLDEHIDCAYELDGIVELEF